MANARSAYLFLYNSALASAWAYVLYRMVISITAGESRPQMYENVKTPLMIAQTAAVMEVLHSALGVVRSPLFTTFIQVLSRLWAVWGVVHQAPEASTVGSVKLFKIGNHQLELSMYTLLFAWGVTEVLRYGFFAVKEVMTPPYPLLWLRYSAFIPLYPLGVASELTMASLALPVIRVKRPLTLDMPNALNWGFDYYCFCWLVIACYLPGLPFLYMYMLQQRQKILGTPKTRKAKAV